MTHRLNEVPIEVECEEKVPKGWLEHCAYKYVEYWSIIYLI